jgi:hypothetical protein
MVIHVPNYQVLDLHHILAPVADAENPCTVMRSRWGISPAKPRRIGQIF